MQGQRAVVTAPGQIDLEAFAPTKPGPKQVLLRAFTTLISPGTERAFFLNLDNTNPPIRYTRDIALLARSLNAVTKWPDCK